MSSWLQRIGWRLSQLLSEHDLDVGVLWLQDEPTMFERARLLREAGAQIGDATTIGHIRLYGRPDQLEIGANCSVFHAVGIVTDGWAAIGGRDAWRGSRVRLLDYCWVFRGCWLLPGVSVGPNVLLAPGSVVTRDIPAGCVAMGQPARAVMSLDRWAERAERMRANHPEEFAAYAALGMGAHSNAPGALASWLEVIGEQRTRRQASTVGLPSPEQVRLIRPGR